MIGLANSLLGVAVWVVDVWSVGARANRSVRHPDEVTLRAGHLCSAVWESTPG